jgi:ribA/ribD-fused uncharacterized protein
MNYSLDWLKQETEKRKQPEFLFFWGHTPKQEAVIDKSCLSQWFPSPFTVDGITYLTGEHWMMAKKAALFNDVEMLKKILDSDKPSVAKEMGRKVKNFDPEIWSKACLEIVIEGNFHKFSQHDELKKFLLDSGTKVIVEASPRDKVWGIGLSQNAPESASPFTWKGTNLLGFALMEVRDCLKITNEKAIKINPHD